MSNIVVYTANFGSRDSITVQDRAILHETHAKFCAFIDENSPQVYDAMSESTKWWVRGPSLFSEILRHSDARHLARFHKALSFRLFPDADWTIWMDAHVKLMVTPEHVIRHVMASQLTLPIVATFNHCIRRTVEQEATTVKAVSLDMPAIVDDALAAYQHEGCPTTLPLAETPVVIRRNCHEAKAFETYWFNELNHRSVRDQISFPYACWKAGFQWTPLPGARHRNPFFKMRR